MFGLFKKNKKNANVEDVSAITEVASTPTPTKSGAVISKINLQKKEVEKICLTKQSLDGLVAYVKVIIDWSGSMCDLVADGTVQATVENTVPLGLQFDDNGETEVYLFSNSFKQLPNCTLENVVGYVDRYAKMGMCGTYYAPVIYNISNESKKSNIPTYCIFITDGDNMDHSAAEAAIKEASEKPIFWQFIGIGNDNFDFLSHLDNMPGRYVDNASFFKVNNPKDIKYSDLLKEFPKWLQNQKVQAMLK